MKRVASLIVVLIAITAVAMAASMTVAETNVTGTWKLSVETPNGTGTPTVVFKQEGEKLTGSYKGRFGESPLTGTVKGNAIQFSFKVNAQGQELEVTYTGTVDGSTMSGTAKFGEMGEGKFTGKKE